jgi:arylsulfatase A-like enzyme
MKKMKAKGYNRGGAPMGMAPPGTKVPAMIKRPPASAPGTKVPAIPQSLSTRPTKATAMREEEPVIKKTPKGQQLRQEEVIGHVVVRHAA